MKCKCGSYAINQNLHGRDNTDLDLCDVCYWRKRATSTQQLKAEIAKIADEVYQMSLLHPSEQSFSHIVDRMRQLSAV